MAISIKDVQVGRFFVNEYMVREISREGNGDNIFYYSYLLETGEPAHETSDMCSKRQITRWAIREATPIEISRMQTKEARRQETNSGMKMMYEILYRIPDEVLIEEIKRRGLSLD